MAWLNLNDSLNQIKGQITSFATGVLTDGVVNDTVSYSDVSDANKKIEELQNVCSRQESEIAALKKQNAEYYETSSKTIPKNASNRENNSEENWSWDPPDSSNASNHKIDDQDEISNLKKKIEELEIEKKDLFVSLEQLDVDCQQTTDKLVTLKDSLQLEVQDLKRVNEFLAGEREALLQEKRNNNVVAISQELKKLKIENENLLKQHAQSQKSDDENQITSFSADLEEKNSLIADLQEKYQKKCTHKESIEKEFENFKQDKEVELISLQKELTTVKHDLEKFKKEKRNQEDFLKQHQNVLGQLEERNKTIEQEKRSLEMYMKTFEKLQEEHEALQRKYQELESGRSKIEFQDNRSILDELHEKLQHAEDEITVLKSKSPSTKVENHEIAVEDESKKYINILTETMKKYLDYEVPTTDITMKPSEDKNVTEFNAVVEVFLKLLLDFKWKAEALERQLCEVSQEKAKLISEKNYEIEKLLQNSEILSQEVIMKSQTMKQYEYECSELIKNNDVLISELQNYKNNSGLQTISESNEDNLLLLENQLETANKRIKDLELIISDLESAKQDDTLETQTELEYIKKQLNMTGRELSQSKKDNQELLMRFKQTEVDNSVLKNELAKFKTSYDLCFGEKQDLKSAIEKMKLDYENAEYKYTEAHVDYEEVKEDLEKCLREKEELMKNCKKLESRNQNTESRVEDLLQEINNLKSELSAEETVMIHMEQQIRNFEEKLQSAKMSETSFKLQCDTVHKELLLANELKQNMEATCKEGEAKLAENRQMIEKLTDENIQLHHLKNEKDQWNKEMEELQKQLKAVTENHQQLVMQKEASSNAHSEEMTKDLLWYKNKTNESAQQTAELQAKVLDLENAKATLTNNFTAVENQLKFVENEKAQIVAAFETSKQHITTDMEKIAALERQLNDAEVSKNELLTELKTKYQENVQYYNEIQRINVILNAETEKCVKIEEQLRNLQQGAADASNRENAQAAEEKDKEMEKLTDQNNFLREKCEVLAENLLQEQANAQKILAEKSSSSDRENSLAKELERLRVHLVEIEDTYTQELLQAEQRNQEMLSKVNEIEQREKNSSTIYTSVSIRANQQVETLQTQLQLVTVQRDEIQKRVSEAEDRNNKQKAALTNLQCALDQFRRDQENEIQEATKLVRRQVEVEKAKQTDLQKEINGLKKQLEESKQGLQAASRLAYQLEKSKQQAVSMKDEVAKLQEKLAKTEQNCKSLSSQTDSKVDKTLIKNLIIGFVTHISNLTKDQNQILRIIATVLDFNEDDSEKVHLNKQPGSWLNSILHPASGQPLSQQSLSAAFVRFLETESQPKVLPSLLGAQMGGGAGAADSSGGGANAKPLVMSEVVLPTFADFAQNRNSSSILKDVLKEN